MKEFSGMILRSGAFAAVSAMLCINTASAADYDVNFTTTPPVIDGTVDAIWSTAATAEGFVVYNNVGTAADQQTQVRLLYDNQKLYMLFEAQDSEIVAPATGNHQGFDFGSPQDTAEIFLDPSLSQDTVANDRMYHIAINPSADAFIYSEAGQNSTNWFPNSADTEFAFSSTGFNWKVEMSLAWEDFDSTYSATPGVLAGPPPSGSVWGMQLGRLHSPGDSSIVASKWYPTSGAFRFRPLGLVRFAGPENQPSIDVSNRVELYSTSFEAPTYSAGMSANGIDGWSAANPSLFEVSTDFAKTGTQSLKALAQTPTGTIRNEKQTTNTDVAQIVQYAIRLPLDYNGYSYRHVLYLSGEYNGSNDVAGQIWFQGRPDSGANMISVYSYEDPGNESAATGNTFPGLQAFDEWSYVTVRVNPVTATYEVWINDTKLVRQSDGLDAYPVKRSSDFLQLTTAAMYNKGYGTEPVYIDDFTQVLDTTESGIADWQLF